MESSVVLLSGGMDSATALFWALKYTHVKAVINFDYGQRGAVFEYSKACKLVDFIRAQKGEGAKGIQFIQQAYHFPSQSALLAGSPLIDLERDQRELPATFVPARNLIFISIAAGISYSLGANYIVGGWSEVDVDYPDCKVEFLRAAEHACRLALGQTLGETPLAEMLKISFPLVLLSKTCILQMGEKLGVPWGLTRSCYLDKEAPCLVCDSCILRVNAFLEAGIRDPIVPAAQWALMVERQEKEE